jgi:hypothetical protein
MIREIANPAAYASVSWLTPEDGGRRTGPPTAAVYASTCVFGLGGEAEVMPDWPESADQLSILLQEVSVEDGNVRLCKVDFLARELAREFLYPDAQIVILEDPRIVANAIVRQVMKAPDVG